MRYSLGDWTTRLSMSSLRELECRNCHASFEAWRYESYCGDCEIPKHNWPALRMKGGAQYKGHSIQAIDGKEFYHEEWIKKKAYKRYIDYEEQEKKPMLDLAAKQFQTNQTIQKQIKEKNDQAM